MSGTKEEQQAQKIASLCSPILKTALGEIRDEGHQEHLKTQQLVENLRQEQINLRQEHIKMQVDIAALHSLVQFMLDSKEPIEKVIKGKTATVSATVVEVSTGEKSIKTATAFLQHALANEVEFGLRSKFPIINSSESKLSGTDTVEVFRTKKDYIKKLGTEVWKNGNIQTEIKEIHKKWNEKKSIIVQSDSLEEDA